MKEIEDKITELEKENNRLKTRVKKLEKDLIEDEYSGGLKTEKFLTALVTKHLEDKIKRMENDLIHDELTGLKTRKYLVERVKLYLKTLFPSNDSKRAFDENVVQEHVGFLFYDIDHFKSVNDTLGHAAGDEVLKQVADVIEKSVRERDIVARFGGEEVLIALLGALLVDAEKVAEKIRKAVEELSFEKYPDLHVTVSIGVISTEIPYRNVIEGEGRIDSMFDEYVRRSDSAVYTAKNKGRNRVVVWSPELEKKQHSPSFSNKVLKRIKSGSKK